MKRTLVDTSVWIAHLRKPQEPLIALLAQGLALVHNAVIGELACGSLPARRRFLEDIQLMPRSLEADFQEVLALIESQRLHGKGIGWVDAQLISSAILSDASLLTYDRRLAEVFSRLSR